MYAGSLNSVFTFYKGVTAYFSKVSPHNISEPSVQFPPHKFLCLESLMSSGTHAMLTGKCLPSCYYQVSTKFSKRS
jgi:hypothetical protein